MVIQALAFWLFATVLIAAGAMVVTARNPVHSVLFLILAFFNAAGLFVLLGAEFLAMILVVVYVGAVAVLFLFVVMMLDINFVQLRAGFMRYLPIGTLIGLVLVAELVLVFHAWGPDVAPAITAPTPALTQANNTAALGALLYTRYVYVFQAAGMILLTAMIGAIVLTLRARQDVKRQRVGVQQARLRRETVELVKMPPGQGV